LKNNFSIRKKKIIQINFSKKKKKKMSRRRNRQQESFSFLNENNNLISLDKMHNCGIFSKQVSSSNVIASSTFEQQRKQQKMLKPKQKEEEKVETTTEDEKHILEKISKCLDFARDSKSRLEEMAKAKVKIKWFI
jgi:hypothetical protein